MRTHPDHVVAAALAAYDCIGSNDFRAVVRAAAAVNLPESTVRTWVEGKRYISPDIAEARVAKKSEITDKLETIAHRLIDCIPSKLDTAPLNQVAVALGICIDKRQLLLGQPNSIQAGVYLTSEARDARLKEIFQRRLEGRNLPPDVGQTVGQDSEIPPSSDKSIVSNEGSKD